jgi:hypothetical protein
MHSFNGTREEIKTLKGCGKGLKDEDTKEMIPINLINPFPLM